MPGLLSRDLISSALVRSTLPALVSSSSFVEDWIIVISEVQSEWANSARSFFSDGMLFGLLFAL